MRTRGPARGWWLAFALLGACSVDRSSNPGTRCLGDADCSMGETCYRGFCVLGSGRCDDDGAAQPCFTGSSSAIGRGLCRQGERRCVGGVFTSCVGEVLPQPEVCDGADNDCDGVADDFDEASCESSGLGACREGRWSCVGATAVCRSSVEPTSEACNGVDDDCDGDVDEQTAVACYPTTTTGCVQQPDGTFACIGQCATGMRACVGGSLGECVGARTPSSEVCTAVGVALDENCDGSTDEGCPCDFDPPTTQSCYGGPAGTVGTGVCRMGLQTCMFPGTYGPCVGEVRPSAESCANPGADDDCDGANDDIDGLGMACIDDAKFGECREGTLACVGLALACATPAPAPVEACDLRDDDCNGTVDDGFDLLTDERHCGMCDNACSASRDCCAGNCVDTARSADHCGMCGNSCGAGRACCRGDCVDTASDPAHCGACGNACATGEVCCNGACANLDASASHCGACGFTCATGEECCGGVCRAVGSPFCRSCAELCVGTTTCCQGSCVDFMTSTAHCGACGAACDEGELCCGGSCVTQGPENCGMCGLACAAGQACLSGVCCEAGEVLCGGQCTDTSSSQAHCGACGTACTLEQTCTGGVCCPGGPGC